jgi:hypothetical protein
MPYEIRILYSVGPKEHSEALIGNPARKGPWPVLPIASCRAQFGELLCKLWLYTLPDHVLGVAITSA